MKDDKQYFIEPVMPNKIEHALQKESQTVGENATSFEEQKENLKDKKQKEKDATSTEVPALKPAGVRGKKVNKAEDTRESPILGSEIENAEKLVAPEEQYTDSKDSKEHAEKKETGEGQLERDDQDFVNDSEKRVEPEKKLSHSKSREEDKIQIKVPEMKRREIDTVSQKTAPIQKDDSTELKYVVEEPTEGKERNSQQTKKHLDVVEMLDDRAEVDEKVSSFTVQEPETPPSIAKTDLSEELELREETSTTKQQLPPIMTEEKSIGQRTPSQIPNPSVPKRQTEIESPQKSRGHKMDHIKTKPQEREVATVGFREC